jgi:hypothetical protein
VRSSPKQVLLNFFFCSSPLLSSIYVCAPRPPPLRRCCYLWKRELLYFHIVHLFIRIYFIIFYSQYCIVLIFCLGITHSLLIHVKVSC